MTTEPDTTPAVAAFPPAPDREQEIRARRAAITDAPWGVYRDLDGQYTVQAGAYVTLTEGFASSGDVATVLGDDDAHRYHRSEFVARAPRDIDDLLALVDRLKAERDEALLRLHAAAMTRTWTNEDGKKFVFVEDIAPVLLGTEKAGEGR